MYPNPYLGEREKPTSLTQATDPLGGVVQDTFEHFLSGSHPLRDVEAVVGVGDYLQLPSFQSRKMSLHQMG